MAAALVAWMLKFGTVLSVAIAGGWQPMPDRSQGYEYVVQLEPELVESIQRGQSIPLSVDVPDHVRPINRIRIVIGQSDVPQQTLATSLKPWPASEKLPKDGVVETQFTTNSVQPRYDQSQFVNQAVNQAAAPVNDSMTNAQNEFARSLQNGGQSLRNSVNQATGDILPPEAGRSVSNAVDRGSQHLGENLQSIGNTAREDIRQMFGGQPASNQNEIMPPGAQNSTSSNQNTFQTTPILPTESQSATNSPRRLDQPITPNNNSWQSSVNTPNVSSPQSRNSVASAPATSNGTDWMQNTGNNSQQSSPSSATNAGVQSNNANRYEGVQGFSSSNNSAILPQANSGVPQSPPLNSVNRYDSFTNSPNNGLATADTRNDQSTLATGPNFPSFTPSLGGDQSITPTPSQPSSTPEIRRDMFNQPANAEIRGANGLPIGQEPVRQPQTTNAQTASTQTTSSQPTSAAAFGWDTKPQTQIAQTVGAQSGPVFPLLLSWVLLSGSGAGNLYLFWSYLDVRNKYRDLVDDAARRISGRRVRD